MKVIVVMKIRKEDVEMKLVNLTPHEIRIISGEKSLSINPSGIVARVKVEKEMIEEVEIDGVIVPIYRNVYGEVEGLLDEDCGVYYIVSGLVAQASTRDDLVFPGELVRDNEGRVIGTLCLSKY